MQHKKRAEETKASRTDSCWGRAAGLSLQLAGVPDLAARVERHPDEEDLRWGWTVSLLAHSHWRDTLSRVVWLRAQATPLVYSGEVMTGDFCWRDRWPKYPPPD